MSKVDIRDLRDWLDDVEKLGEVTHITQEVDPHLEMGALTYLNGKNAEQTTLLFENPKGHQGDVRVLFNPIGNSMNRLSLAMRTQPGKTPIELVQYIKEKFDQQEKIKPISIDPKDAPIFDNVWMGRYPHPLRI